MLIQGTQPTVLSNERKRHSETVMLQATFFLKILFVEAPGSLKGQSQMWTCACSLVWCLHSGSPPAQGQSRRVRTNGSQTEVSSSIKSLESLGLRHLLLKKGVFCQLRRQQISDNFNGVKAFIYAQTWSIKSVRQRGGLFFLQLKHMRTMCHDPKPLDQEKNTFIPI